MIHLRLDPRAAAPAHAYRVAGHALQADRPLAWLAPFPVVDALPAELPALELAMPEPAAGEILFEGRAFLARRERQLACRRHPEGFAFAADGLGDFFYRDGNSYEPDATLAVVEPAPEAPAELLEEVLLGPLLALALAQRGVFLLHAGGCEIAGEAFLFLGESGAGKSTLAARLGAPRLADDQAAVDALSHQLLPGFPQPKLDRPAQSRIAGTPRRPLGGLLLVEKASAEAEPRLDPLHPLAAAAGIVRHTTAARCFDHTLLRAHLDFAASLAAQVPCFRLVYPHHPAAPEKIGALLARG